MIIFIQTWNHEEGQQKTKEFHFEQLHWCFGECYAISLVAQEKHFWFHLFTSSLHASSYLCWPFVYTVHHNSTWLEYLKSQSASQNTIQSILYRNYILLKNSLDFLWIDLWCEANVNKKFNKTLLKLWCKTI